MLIKNWCVIIIILLLLLLLSLLFLLLLLLLLLFLLLSLILLLLTIVIIIRRHTETPTEENVDKFLAYYISLATSQLGRKQTMKIKEVAGKFQHAQT